MKAKRNIVVIPSGGTNLFSVKDAIAEVGYEAIISTEKSKIDGADKVILPGVGSAGNAMRILKELDLIDCIKNLQQDTLGICLGMQLLFDASEENNQTCLGIIPAKIRRLPSSLVAPHMGWNELMFLKTESHLLFKDIKEKDFVYFTHSYYATLDDAHTLAYTDYEGMALGAVVQKDNFFGMQFHPERSSKTGMRLLKNFLEL